jgi:hypothetical protein
MKALQVGIIFAFSIGGDLAAVEKDVACMDAQKILGSIAAESPNEISEELRLEVLGFLVEKLPTEKIEDFVGTPADELASFIPRWTLPAEHQQFTALWLKFMPEVAGNARELDRIKTYARKLIGRSNENKNRNQMVGKLDPSILWEMELNLTGAIVAVELSPDQNLLLYAGGDKPQETYLYDLKGHSHIDCDLSIESCSGIQGFFFRGDYLVRIHWEVAGTFVDLWKLPEMIKLKRRKLRGSLPGNLSDRDVFFVSEPDRLLIRTSSGLETLTLFGDRPKLLYKGLNDSAERAFFASSRRIFFRPKVSPPHHPLNFKILMFDIDKNEVTKRIDVQDKIILMRPSVNQSELIVVTTKYLFRIDSTSGDWVADRQELPNLPDFDEGLKISPNARYLVGSQTQISFNARELGSVVYDIQKQKVSATNSRSFSTGIFSSDGRWFLTLKQRAGSHEGLELWDFERMRKLRSYKADGQIFKRFWLSDSRNYLDMVHRGSRIVVRHWDFEPAMKAHDLDQGAEE